MTDTLRAFVLDEVNGMIDSLDESATHEDMGRVLIELRDAVRDGTWQPDPTVEPEHPEILLAGEFQDEPPRIENMAPGTTFRFGKSDTLWTLYYNATFENFYVVSPDGSVWQAEDIDPSTIRDVTPPKGDDRG